MGNFKIFYSVSNRMKNRLTRQTSTFGNPLYAFDSCIISIYGITLLTFVQDFREMLLLLRNAREPLNKFRGSAAQGCAAIFRRP